MSGGISHCADVEFLESCNPPLVERNADEFKCVHKMLVAARPSAERVEKHTRWQSEGSGRYRAHLAEGRALLAEIAEGYEKAASALGSYANALQTAKTPYADGKASEQALATLIHIRATAITREAQQAEPPTGPPAHGPRLPTCGTWTGGRTGGGCGGSFRRSPVSGRRHGWADP